MLKLVVQGESYRHDGEPNVSSLLTARGENMLYVNVRVNDEVLDRRDFENVPVHEGDRIDFLYFMGGGSLVQPDRRRDRTIFKAHHPARGRWRRPAEA